MVLQVTDVEGAIKMAQRIHLNVAKVSIDEIPVQVSIGITRLNVDRDVASDALHVGLQAADKALYRAKEAGRNRSELAHSE